jgi:hypothetical protein
MYLQMIVTGNRRTPPASDPSKDIQVYSTQANHNLTEGAKKVCPGHAGGNNHWPSSYSQLRM